MDNFDVYIMTKSLRAIGSWIKSSSIDCDERVSSFEWINNILPGKIISVLSMVKDATGTSGDLEGTLIFGPLMIILISLKNFLV